MKTKQYDLGFRIKAAATCDMDLMESVDNKTLIERFPDLTKHRTDLILKKVLGISSRYYVREQFNAGDIALSALKNLVQSNPELKSNCDFVIFAGISNPYPTVCMSALLSYKVGISSSSCWDLKSGCSTGVLSLIQALDRFQNGATRGIIIIAENLSRFINPSEPLNYMSIGDGAIAVSIEASHEWKVSGVIHGTDPKFMHHLYVPQSYPESKIQPSFQSEATDELISSLDYYWMKSLEDLLEICRWKGPDVSYYIAHQINESKNKFYAQVATIPENNIFMNLENIGNVGSPSIFYNYLFNILNRNITFKSGEKLILHAVGGGVSWAGIGLEKL